VSAGPGARADTGAEAGFSEFRMPVLGADMERGTLLEWLVHPGDLVHKGQTVAVVDTAKAAIEVESFSEGVVDELLVPEGTEVAVGTPLARLRSGTAASAPSAPAEPVGAPHAGPAEPAGLVTSPVVRRLAERLGVDLAAVHGSGPGGRVTRDDVTRARPSERPAARTDRPRSSPRARRLAAEGGIDLAGVRGTGPGGAVVAEDLAGASAPVPQPRERPRAAADAVTEEKPETSREDGSAGERQRAMREAIGALMARSKREIPHLYLSTTVDMSRATAWLAEANLGRPVASRLLPAALLLKASALAAREVPEVNGFVEDGRPRRAEHVHLGVAVNLRGGGLVAPAVHDADTLPLGDLMAALVDLVGRARAGRLTRPEMTGATLTVTNLGDQGVETVFGVIVPPQVGLVGFGRVAERPWAEHGMLGVRPVVTATLSADHRALDGHRGGLYLAAVDRLLHNPEEL